MTTHPALMATLPQVPGLLNRALEAKADALGAEVGVCVWGGPGGCRAAMAAEAAFSAAAAGGAAAPVQGWRTSVWGSGESL